MTPTGNPEGNIHETRIPESALTGTGLAIAVAAMFMISISAPAPAHAAASCNFSGCAGLDPGGQGCDANFEGKTDWGYTAVLSNPARKLVRVGAGVRSRDLAAAAGPHGLAASLGSGPTTSVAGYTMFGGLGALGRAVGFMAAKVAAADVVTAGGSPAAVRHREPSGPAVGAARRGWRLRPFLEEGLPSWLWE